ncbi:MAG: DUF87 domain-containing protein [Planctomycetales bacterium]|nr:DUF87 domain-containing protein [Planctomycetales bacterium]NIM09407.1 DUF87 domain-containing protein [Planctomycetales bacterium]NIN08881.1 DUF87 domain-containing protein [Planctomycetales bacterium]NIN77996.1 DUF87 domain-containing protein [Planctomycetales bacterium]NIO35179.1 DUF87 domain-containing protein [Planctomycetales bacterium]
MFENRNAKFDALALALLAVVVFIGLALISYDRADVTLNQGQGILVYPAPAQTQNMCGWVGAWLSDGLLRLLGVGAYYGLVSLFVLDLFLLMRRQVNQRVLRLLGWSLSLVGITTLAAMVMPRFLPTTWYGPEIGPGGLLGAAGRGLVLMHFATIGAYVLCASFVLAGLLLCTDYVLFKLGLLCLVTPYRVVTGAGRSRAKRGAKLSRQRKNKASDLTADSEQDEEEDVDQQQEPAVRILGRRMKPRPDVEDEEDACEDEYDEDEDEDEDYEEEEVEDEYEEEDEDEEEEEWVEQPPRVIRARQGGRGVRRRLAAALRIKQPPVDHEREEMIASLEAASHVDEASKYELPDLDLLLEAEQMEYEQHEKEVRHKAKLLERTFASFGFNVRVVEIETGPVIAQYEVELESGLRLSKITGLADDLAIALRVPSVRIVAPIPGKNTVGIEVPNTERQLVRLREVIEEDSARARKMKIPVFLGKDVSGNPMTVDLAALPHLLIAGRTGTGKSVCLNSIIASMIMTRRPDEVKMLMIDPKMVELSPYKKLPHLMHPVVTDMKKAEAILGWAVDKMEERYALLARAGVRHVSVYNQLGEEELIERMEPESDDERQQIPLHLPYIVIIADEMADLMMTAAKEVEGHIIRLAQKSRAVGIHLVLATQKPTVDVITGLIKSNLPARIAFQVASRTDSRVVLDEMGADKLLGNGDMLFLWPGTSSLLRGQGTFLSDDEISGIVSAVATDEPQFVRELVHLKPADSGDGKNGFKDRDELYESAIDTVVREGRGSVSLLQRTLGIGYGRAARLIDYMAEDGFVGAYNGSQAREVMLTPEQWATLSSQVTEGDASLPPRRRNKITLASDNTEWEDEPEKVEKEFAQFQDDENTPNPYPAGEEDEYEEDEYEEDEYEEDDEDEYEEDEYDSEEEDYEEEDEYQARRA